MPLSDGEALRFYDTITTRAREVGLSWIVSQVEEQIALGNVAPRSLAVKERNLFIPEEDLFASKSRRRKSTKATFLVSRPYTTQERLVLLIDGLLIGIVQVNQIADKVIALAASELEASSVEFAPEAEVKSVFRLETRSVRFTESSERLATLLNELIREVSNGE